MAADGGQTVIARSLIAAAAALIAGAHDASAQDSVRCDSSPGVYNYCRVDTGPGVSVLRQHSRHPCFEGDTWGYDRRGVWVANGCRATFHIGPPPAAAPDETADAAVGAKLALGLLGRNGEAGPASPPPADVIAGPGQGPAPARMLRCESDDYAFKRCPAIVKSYVELSNQRSSGPRGVCTFNKSWGYDRTGIWVDAGCRADFAIY